MEGIISMSAKEVERMRIMEDLKHKRIKQHHAAIQLGLSVRQVKRLRHQYRLHGAHGLVHKNRGRSSNRAMDQVEKDRISSIIREHYPDFGPTFAHEKLTEQHGITCSDEMVRKLMTAAGLWHAKKHKQQAMHPPRERRACVGELIQLDGSPHAWFEDRADRCVLLAFIDDATSQIMDGQFVDYEGTFPLFAVTEHYLKTYGKPVTVYTDRHSTYKINRQATVEEELRDAKPLSQFGRAMDQLGIELIFANSPQAKGRVERLFETLQDRLVKELRLAKITTKAAATVFFREVYIPKHNAKFASLPRQPQNLHRPLLPTDDLATIFTLQSKRIVTKDLQVQYKNSCYQLLPLPGYRTTIKGVAVVVVEDQTGTVTFRYKEQIVPYAVGKRVVQQKQQQVVSAKDLTKRRPYMPAVGHPWRRPFVPAA